MHQRAAIDSCGRQYPCVTRTASVAPTNRTCRAWILDGGAAWAEAGRAPRPVTSRGEHRRAPLLQAHAGSGGASAEQGRNGSLPSTAGASPAVVTTPSTVPHVGETAAAALADGEGPSWPALQPPFTYYATAEDALSNTAPSGLSPVWKVLLLSDGSVTRHLQLISGAPVSVECLSMRNVGWSLEGLPPGTELIPGPRVQRQVLLRCQPGPSAPGVSHSGTSAGSRNGGGSAGTHDAPGDGSDQLTLEGHPSSPPQSQSQSPGRLQPQDSPPPVPPGLPQRSPAAGPEPPSAPGAPFQPLVYASSWWNADAIDEYLRDKSKPIWVSLSQGHVELYREVHALFRGESPALEELLGCQGPFWGRQYTFWSGGRPLTLIYEVFSQRLQQYLGPMEAREQQE